MVFSICSVAWHTPLSSPALTVFVTKFNYIKLIEKFPVTSDKTKSFSSFSNPPVQSWKSKH